MTLSSACRGCVSPGAMQVKNHDRPMGTRRRFQRALTLLRDESPAGRVDGTSPCLPPLAKRGGTFRATPVG